MTIIDKLIWEMHTALKSGKKRDIKRIQEELLKEGYIIENSYMLTRPSEPGYVQNVNIPFLEKRFKNLKK
jgi:hypothetical protein